MEPLSAFRAPIVRIGALAVVVRVAWLLAVPSLPADDARLYDELGWRLAEMGRFADAAGNPEVHWPVGYPLVLAGLYRAFGHVRWPFQVLNLALGAGVAMLGYVFARRSRAERIAVAAGVLLAVLPSHVAMTSICIPQGLLAFLLLAGVVFWDRVRSVPAAFAAGLVAGFAGLVKGTYLPLPFAFLALQAARGAISPAAGARRAAALVVGIVVVVAPWTARNHARFGKFIPLAASWGHVLWIGNNPHATGRYWYPEDPALNPLVAEPDPLRRDDLGKRLAVEFVREHPEKLPALAARKLWGHFRDDVLTYGWATKRTSRELPAAWLEGGRWGTQIFYALLLLGALGYYARESAARLRRPRPPWREIDAWVGVVVAWNVGLALVFHGATKYHFVLLPFLAPAAAAFWGGLGTRRGA